MQILKELPPAPLGAPSFLTIGNFDGVHLGHQELVLGMVATAHSQGCVAGALTFNPHPLAVLRPEMKLSHLSSPEERAGALEALGLDFLLELPFTRETASTPAELFVEMLARALLYVSFGSVRTSRSVAAARVLHRGWQNWAYDTVTGCRQWVRSRPKARRCTAAAYAASCRARAMPKAQRDFSGARTSCAAVVQHGQGRGQRLGFPTANVEVPEGRLIPAYGVYACWAWVGGKGIPSAVSIGSAPHFR